MPNYIPIIEYCAEEVARQYYHRTGHEAARAVPRMIAAWHDALHRRASTIDRETAERAVEDINAGKVPRLYEFNEKDLLRWAKLIEPEKNAEGYRTVGVRVGNDIKARPEHVPLMMEQYFQKLPDLTPEEAYFEFEEVHPFLDGNGRVGKIILNWKNNTLRDPIWPTNKWGILNP